MKSKTPKNTQLQLPGYFTSLISTLKTFKYWYKNADGYGNRFNEKR